MQSPCRGHFDSRHFTLSWQHRPESFSMRGCLISVQRNPLGEQYYGNTVEYHIYAVAAIPKA